MHEARQRRRFDLVELALILLVVVPGVWYVARWAHTPVVYSDPAAAQEFDRLRAQYGPRHYSQYYEEWIVRDFFKDRRDGVFVDVGASHYKDGSTTYFLEEQLGWSGVAIDPQQQFEEDYRRHRPRTRFFPFFVSDRSNETATLYMVNEQSQTVSARTPPSDAGAVTRVSAPTITLTDLLDRLQIPRVDFISIDVEGAEPDVLRGLDIRRFTPALVCVEAHADVRQQVLEYFAKHSYVVVGRYLRVDPLNLYFAPLEVEK